MTNLLMIDDSPEVKNLLFQCLETAGFKVCNSDNGIFYIQLSQEKTYSEVDINNAKKSNILHSIFPSIPRLGKVFRFIELHYHQSIKLKDVAQAVGYSSAYLTDLVKHMTGKTVNSWIIERRIVEASSLLIETNESIEDIALKVGYQNTNHFYSQFRNYYHTTPRSWRERQRSKLDR